MAANADTRLEPAGRDSEAEFVGPAIERVAETRQRLDALLSASESRQAPPARGAGDRCRVPHAATHEWFRTDPVAGVRTARSTNPTREIQR